MNKAFIFPGQGSQVVGMGREFYDNFELARDTFGLVNEALGRNLSDIIFNGPSDVLTMTTNAQPALMTISMAILNVMIEQTNQSISKLCSYTAGHSLGEYTALCAAQAFDLATTARLLDVRGREMQSACPEGVGAMAACMNVSMENLEKILQDVAKYGVCQIANDNIDGQIVISGETKLVDQVVSIVKDLGGKAIKLKVSAPFHCSLMKPAEEKMRIALDEAVIHVPMVPVIQNVNAISIVDPEKIKQNLVMQICGRVRWRETLDTFAKLVVEEIVEIGSGAVLTGMIKKTQHDFKLTNIATIADLENYLGVK